MRLKGRGKEALAPVNYQRPRLARARMASAVLGRQRCWRAWRTKRHGAIVYNKQRRSARGAGASELVVDDGEDGLRGGYGQEKGGGGMGAKQEHRDLLLAGCLFGANGSSIADSIVACAGEALKLAT
jgi:hypothetical protein